MTKEEKARSIIRQGGECNGVSCCSGEDNECPCYSVCTGGIDKDPRKVIACQNLLERVALHDSQQPSKTLLDEFAMAAMAAIVGKGERDWHPDGDDYLDDINSVHNRTARGAYDYSAAMMKERARRDEMGNVKEVK